MRNISFSLTTPQFLAKTKTVTRRLGWKNLKPGELLQGVEKGMGLKKGQHPVKLHVVRVVDVRREPLNEIGAADVVAEGFPHLTPAQFVAMFCNHNGCQPDTVITRISFDYV